MYIILKNKKEIYFWKKLCESYNIEELYSMNSDNFIFKLLIKLNIVPLGKWKDSITKYNEFIIFESMYNPKVAELIKKKNKNSKIILYFWNPINENNKNFLKDNNIDEFWTFDKNDSEKYHMKYNPQFYTKKVEIEEKDKEKDVVFLGRPKNRRNSIESFRKQLEKRGVTTNFKLIDNEKDFITYEQYLNMVASSKCILDYSQEGQVGLTLRPLESMFLKKKLITNNEDIENYDFYSKNNIFIINKDDMKNINEFINSPYEEVDEKIVENYDFEQWLKRFEG